MEIFIAINPDDLTMPAAFKDYTAAENFVQKAKDFGIDFKIRKATLNSDVGVNPYQVEVRKDKYGELKFGVIEAETAHDFISSFRECVFEMNERAYFTLFAKDKVDAIEQVRLKLNKLKK